MRVLGAILAGGRSRRFGSDKAAALVDSVPLLERVADGIRPQVESVIVVGRSGGIADYPVAGLGPLGGLCAALKHADEEKFDAVLTAGCDVLPVPPNLLSRFSPGPSVVAGQPLFGLWPIKAFEPLLLHLIRGEDRSVRNWIVISGARLIDLDVELHNLNTPDDLARYEGRDQPILPPPLAP